MKTFRLAALLTAFAFCGEAQTFRVSGTLVDSESGARLNRSRVTLSSGSREWNVVTTSDGAFSFDVPQGKYVLVASHHEWKDVYGEPPFGDDSGAAVVTGPCCDPTHLLFRFRRPVAVRGKIVGESGEPIPSATVEVFQQSVIRGRRHLESLGRAESDDFGEYSFSRLPAATYYLAATGAPWYRSDLFMTEGWEHSGASAAPYGIVYFPGSSDPRGGSPVVLRSGAEFQADFILRPVSGASILPKFPDGLMYINGTFTLRADGPPGAQAIVRMCDGGCSGGLADIPPGNYQLSFTYSEGVLQVPLSVSGGDVPIEMALKPAPVLAGKVVFDSNPTVRPRFPLYVRIEDERTGELQSVPVHSDGAFSWPHATIGEVRLHLAGADGFFSERMSVDGASVTNGVIDLIGGSSVQVRIFASGETGKLTGVVRNGDEPVPAALVVLAPNSETGNSDRHFATQACTDGSYTFANVPVGEYVVFAVDNPEFEYASPAAVRPYLAAGKHVRIEIHGSVAQDVAVSSIPPAK